MINNDHLFEDSSIKHSFSFSEFNKLLSLAGPLILSSIITMGMAFTDVIMIGWLGTTELAASAATSDFHSLFFYIAAGIISATSVFIAHARGKEQTDSVRSIVQQGFLISFICAIPASFIIYNTTFFLSLIGVEETIINAAIPYAHTLYLAFFPMLLMTTLQYFIAAHDKTRIIFLVTLAGLPLNAFGNYLLLFGNLGFPELKLAGAGIATTLTAIFMFLCLLIYCLTNKTLKQYALFHKIEINNLSQLKDLFKTGIPIGISNIGEMGVFLTSTITMGIFGAEVLAAHTIALRLGGLFYAFPLGLSQAAAIRCGFLIAQNNIVQLKAAITTIIKISLVIGLVFTISIWFYSVEIASLFLSSDENTKTVLLTAAGFLLILGVIQPFDALATVSAGILRGMKDTKIPMILSITSYWVIGFSTGLILAFYFNLGGTGIWIGLATGATAFGLATISRLHSHWKKDFRLNI